MTPPIKPRRSLLYVSADVPRHLEKARDVSADGIIFDLHDAVAPEHKEEARARLVEVLAAGGFRNQELVVRVNPLDSPWGDQDLAAIATSGCDAVLFPGLCSAQGVQEAIARLDAAGGGDLPVMLMIESPMAVLRAEDMAVASERVCCLVVNTAALAATLRVSPTSDRIGLFTSLGLVVLAARAHGKMAVDGSHLDLNEAQTCERSCRQGRELGFDGKCVVHPVQLPYTNDTFTPRIKEVEKARAVIRTMEQAQLESRPYAVLEGRLLQPVELDAARRVVALHQAIRERETAYNDARPSAT